MTVPASCGPSLHRSGTIPGLVPKAPSGIPQGTSTAPTFVELWAEHPGSAQDASGCGPMALSTRDLHALLM